MNEANFQRGLSRLCAYCGKKVDSWAAEYWARTKHIPDAVWDEIVGEWINTHKPQANSLPSPGEIVGWWVDWLTAHPEQRARREVEHCDDCGGDGCLTVEVPDTRGPHKIRTCQVFCGSCRNGVGKLPPKITPRLTRREIDERGWKCLTKVFAGAGEVHFPRASAARAGFVSHVSDALERYEQESDR